MNYNKITKTLVKKRVKLYKKTTYISNSPSNILTLAGNYVENIDINRVFCSGYKNYQNILK